MKGNYKYPWDRWLARKRPFILVKGKDYHCMTHAMAIQVRHAASKRGLNVSVFQSTNEDLEVRVHHD